MNKKDKLLLTVFRILNFVFYTTIVMIYTITTDYQNLPTYVSYIIAMLIFTVIRFQYFNKEIYVKVYYIVELIAAILSIVGIVGVFFLPDEFTDIVLAIIAVIVIIGLVFAYVAAKKARSKK